MVKKKKQLICKRCKRIITRRMLHDAMLCRFCRRRANIRRMRQTRGRHNG